MSAQQDIQIVIQDLLKQNQQVKQRLVVVRLQPLALATTKVAHLPHTTQQNLLVLMLVRTKEAILV